MQIDRVRQLLADAGYSWPPPRWVASTGSTNADLLSQTGLLEGTVLAAGEQTAGRGRLDRSWVSAPGAGIWCSVMIRPQGEVVPLVAGVAAVDALAPWVDVQLKWPNDLVTPAGKLGGILAEVDDGVAVGIGINVSEAPVAGSVALANLTDAAPDIETVFAGLLVALANTFRDARRDPHEILQRYRAVSATIGRHVVLRLPGEEMLEGMAIDVDTHGHLVLETAAGTRIVAAGDVVHATLRP